MYQWIDSLPGREVGFDVSNEGPTLETSNLVFRLGGGSIHWYICCLLSATHTDHGLKFVKNLLYREVTRQHT